MSSKFHSILVLYCYSVLFTHWSTVGHCVNMPIRRNEIINSSRTESPPPPPSSPKIECVVTREDFERFNWRCNPDCEVALTSDHLPVPMTGMLPGKDIWYFTGGQHNQTNLAMYKDFKGQDYEDLNHVYFYMEYYNGIQVGDQNSGMYVLPIADQYITFLPTSQDYEWSTLFVQLDPLNIQDYWLETGVFRTQEGDIMLLRQLIISWGAPTTQQFVLDYCKSQETTSTTTTTSTPEVSTTSSTTFTTSNPITTIPPETTTEYTTSFNPSTEQPSTTSSSSQTDDTTVTTTTVSTENPSSTTTSNWTDTTTTTTEHPSTSNSTESTTESPSSTTTSNWTDTTTTTTEHPSTSNSTESTTESPSSTTTSNWTDTTTTEHPSTSNSTESTTENSSSTPNWTDTTTTDSTWTTPFNSTDSPVTTTTEESFSGVDCINNLNDFDRLWGSHPPARLWTDYASDGYSRSPPIPPIDENETNQVWCVDGDDASPFIYHHLSVWANHAGLTLNDISSMTIKIQHYFHEPGSYCSFYPALSPSRDGQKRQFLSPSPEGIWSEDVINVVVSDAKNYQVEGNTNYMRNGSYWCFKKMVFVLNRQMNPSDFDSC